MDYGIRFFTTMVISQPFFLSTQQKKDLAKSGISFEAATYFKYKKTKGGYQTGEHLLNQIIKKALLIREALYPN